MPTDQKSCPYCGAMMAESYFVVGGGVWCCEDKEFMENYVSRTLDEYGTIVEDGLIITPPKPLHCLIGDSGYRGGHGNWPKEGLFCRECLTFVIKGIRFGPGNPGTPY